MIKTIKYNFVTKDKVEFLSIDFEELKIISIHYSYHINDNSIFINKPTKEFYNEKSKPTVGYLEEL